MDAAGRPIGLVSRADALLWQAEGGHADERISDASLAVVHPEGVTAHAIDLILATGQGRLPVTDAQSGALVGLLTRKDLAAGPGGLQPLRGRAAGLLRPPPSDGRASGLNQVRAGRRRRPTEGA